MYIKFDNFKKKHIYNFEQFKLNETLKSYNVDVAEKMLDNFFQKRGYNKKIFLEETKSPHYRIITDKYTLHRMLQDYKKDSYVKYFAEAGLDIGKTIENTKKQIENFKYGDINISADKNDPETAKELLKLIESMGYFVSYISTGERGESLQDKKLIEDTLTKAERISIGIEPYYDEKVSFEGEYLYHTTDKRNIDKIKKFGLVPKSKNTRSFYPERIYLSPNEIWMETIKNQLSSDKSGEYVNMRIKNFKGLNLYKDLRFKGGFFTYDNISPEHIELM